MADFYMAPPFCFEALDEKDTYKYTYNRGGDKVLSSVQAELRAWDTVPFVYHVERIINELYRSGELGILPTNIQHPKDPNDHTDNPDEFNDAIIQLIQKRIEPLGNGGKKGVIIKNEWNLNPKLTPGFICKLTSRIIPGFDPNIMYAEDVKKSVEEMKKLGISTTAHFGYVVKLWKLTPLIQPIESTSVKVKKLEKDPPPEIVKVNSYVYKKPISGLASFFDFPALQVAPPAANIYKAVTAAREGVAPPQAAAAQAAPSAAAAAPAAPAAAPLAAAAQAAPSAAAAAPAAPAAAAPAPQPSIVDSLLQSIGNALAPPPNLPGQPLLSNSEARLANWKKAELIRLGKERQAKKSKVKKNTSNTLLELQAIDEEYDAKNQRIENATEIISQGGTRKRKAKKPSKKITRKRR